MPSLFGSDGPEGLPQTKSGIYYEIRSVEPGPRTDWVPRANRTVIDARIRDGDYRNWLQDMVGIVKFDWDFGSTPGSPTMLSRLIPEFDPQSYLPNTAASSQLIAGLWCTRVEGIDMGGSPTGGPLGPAYDATNGWPVPQWDRYKCTFDALDYVVLDDQTVQILAGAGTNAPEMFRYVSRHVRRKYSEQQIPMGQLFIAGSTGDVGGPYPLPPTAGTFVKVGSAIVKYIWKRVPTQYVPYAAMQACENCVNLGAWDTVIPNGRNWPDGTLRFAGYEDTDQYTDATGLWVVDLTLDFEYRCVGIENTIGKNFAPAGIPLGWNYYIAIAEAGFVKGKHFYGVTTDGNPLQTTGPNMNALYPAVDFNQLFWPQPA